MRYDDDKKASAVVFFALMIMCIALVFMVSYIKAHSPQPKPFEVWDKCEIDGKCYLNVWVEVTPEEYIGVDVGDEYEIKK